jgi:hypothetical protein
MEGWLKNTTVWPQQAIPQYQLPIWLHLLNGWAIPNSEFEEYTYIIKGKKQFIIEDKSLFLEMKSIKKRIPEFNTQIRLIELWVYVCTCIWLHKVHRE